MFFFMVFIARVLQLQTKFYIRYSNENKDL